MHHIERQIVALGSRAKRLLVMFALAVLVAVVLGTVLLLGAADYLLRFDDRGVRIMASLTVAGVVAWTAWRFLLPALRYRPHAVQVAQHVERRFPALADRLSSSVEFLRQSETDPTAGSAELRRAVIAQTEAETADLNWSAAIDVAPTRRAVTIAAVVAAISIGISLIAPNAARIALARLFHPLGGTTWPRQHQLSFVAPPQRVALGKPFEVELIDERGSLPADVRIHYRYHVEGQPAAEDDEKMQLLNGKMVARKDTVTRPFEFRATGGDDDTMPWHAVDVVEPPRVAELTIRVQPPAYTGYAAYDSPRRIEALVGSTLAIAGSSTKPVAAVVLKQEHGAATMGSVVAADAHAFALLASGALPVIVEKSGRYWLELTDAEGLVGGTDDRWDLRAVPDAAPTVSLEMPAVNLFVTPEANINLRAIAKDNLAIQSMWLVYVRSDQSDQGEQRVELHRGPEQAMPGETESPISAPGESRAVDYRWDLGPLGLAAGTQLSYRITADDYQPKTGSSIERKITIVTPAELEDRLAARQAAIMAELARVLKMEQAARLQTTALAEQLQTVGEFRKQDLDQLQGAELNQRQVRRSLTSAGEGIVGQVADLLAELAANKVPSPEIAQRMEQLQGELTRLERGPLPEIEKQLTAAVKSSQVAEARVDAPAVETALAAAGTGQDEVIAALENLLGELAEWKNHRAVAREITGIRREQGDLEKQTREAAANTLSREAKDLAPQQQADLKKIGRQQADLAQRFEKVQQQMERIAAGEAGDDPTGTAAIADALHAARNQGLAGQMRGSGQQVEQNKLGQALAGQQAVGKGLEELLDILANRREQELAGLVKKLKEAEAQLNDLRNRQEGLKKKIKALAEEAKKPGTNQAELKRELERLTRQQRQLQEETERFARQLQRLQADKAARSTAGAAGQMGGAGESGEAGNAGDAADQAEAAKRDLDEAQQQLAQRRRQAEQDLAEEQLAKIADALKSLAERQTQFVQEIKTYDDLRNKNAGLTRGQSQSVLDVGRGQAALADETKLQAEKIAAAEVFNLALSRAADEMTAAAELLAKLETGPGPQRAAKRALTRLEQILLALADDKDEMDGGKGGDAGSGDGGGGQGSGDGIASIAELKLLKLMQEQLNWRTQELDEATTGQEKPTDAQRTEYIELAREQGRLAELLAKKAAPPAANPEDTPDKLPDVRGENK